VKNRYISLPKLKDPREQKVNKTRKRNSPARSIMTEKPSTSLADLSTAQTDLISSASYWLALYGLSLPSSKEQNLFLHAKCWVIWRWRIVLRMQWHYGRCIIRERKRYVTFNA